MTWHIAVLVGLVLVLSVCFMGFCFVKALNYFVDNVLIIGNSSASDYSQAMAVESMFSEDGSTLHQFKQPFVCDANEDEHEHCSVG